MSIAIDRLVELVNVLEPSDVDFLTSLAERLSVRRPGNTGQSKKVAPWPPKSFGAGSSALGDLGTNADYYLSQGFGQ
jgi:hypothetical protein